MLDRNGIIRTERAKSREDFADTPVKKMAYLASLIDKIKT